MVEKQGPNIGDATPEGVGKLARELREIEQKMQRAFDEREWAIEDPDTNRGNASLERADTSLDHLKSERSRILNEMADRFEGQSGDEPPVPIKDGATKPEAQPTPTTKPEINPDDPYRFYGRPIDEIKRSLRGIKGWRGVETRINRRHGDSLGGDVAPAEIFLSELARQVKDGVRPVMRSLWSEFYDRYNPDGTVKPESAKKQPKDNSDKDQPQAQAKKAKTKTQGTKTAQRARYFDPDDHDSADEAERYNVPPEEWRQSTQDGGLYSDSESGYDKDDILDRRDKMRSSGGTGPETGPDSETRDPMRHLDSDLTGDLRDILEGRRGSEEQRRALEDNNTEAFYGAPPSPIANETDRIIDENDTEAYYSTSRGTQTTRTGTSGGQSHFDRPTPPNPAGDTEAQPQPMSRVERQESIENNYEFEIGGVTFKNGEIVDYTEADGDKARHMVIQKIGENPPNLKLLNLETGTEFAISEQSISRIEKLQDTGGGPPEDDDGDGEGRRREGGEQYQRESYLDGVPKVPTPGEVLALAEGARLNVDGQIQAVAQAKEQREKFFGRNKPDQAELDSANQGLENAYAQYMDNWSAVLADYRGVENDLNDYKVDMQEKITVLDQSIARLEADTTLPPELRQYRIDIRRERILEARAAIQKCDQQIDALHRGVESVTRQIEIEMKLEMAQTRSKIEAAQCALKVGTKSEKFRTFWRSKNGRRARLAVGAALGITGAMIAATGVGAGVGSAMVAGAGAVMRGTGGFMATEAGWNMLHNRRADKADLRGRQNRWGAQTARTQVEAGRDMGYMTEHAEALGAENMSEAELAAFLEANAGALYDGRILRGALAGNADSSAAVAGTLLQSQLDRVNSDAQSNRRAKRGAAVVGVAAAAAPFVLRHFLDGPPTHEPPKGPPKPPTPDAPYDPNAARMRGILSTDESAAQNWQAMTDNYRTLSPSEQAVYKAAEQAYDKGYEAALKGMHLSHAELDRVNFILGRGSFDVGNEQMTQITRSIAQQVQNGASTESILKLYGMPTDRLTGA
jgi:hypothetical protein